MSERDITLTQLRALIAVVDRRSFSAAAAAVGLTQSGVSHAVLSLEAILGDMAALLAMVETGLGVTLVPELALELRGRRLRAVPLRPRVVREIRLLTRRGVEPTPARRAFVSLFPLT